jgi:hypothetical protein
MTMGTLFKTVYYLHLLIFILLVTALSGPALVRDFVAVVAGAPDVRREVLEQTMMKPMR